jgi:hypothetical protein
MFITLTAAMILSVSFSANMKCAKATNNYAIEHVDHTVSIMYNGYVLMNDTIQFSGQGSGSFLFGFPHTFGQYIVRYLASDANATSTFFPVTPNEPLENRSGFYGLKVDFPAGMPQSLSVQVLFSNGLISEENQNASLYTVTFPAFPSLTETANSCNSSLILPEGAQYLTGSVNSTSYGAISLQPFTYNVSTITFQLAAEEMQLFDVDQIAREIDINEFGEITGSDSYYITNKAPSTITSVQVLLPFNASDVNARDQFGRTMQQPELVALNGTRYVVNLTSGTARPLSFDEATRFVVNYRLPSEAYITSPEGNTYVLNMPLYQGVDYYVNSTSVTFILPEGAKLQMIEGDLNGVSYSVVRDVFQERVIIGKQSISQLDSLSFGITYDYDSLWSAFRPTAWAMVLAIVGCIAIVVITRPKGPTAGVIPTAATLLRPEYLKSFVESYEEKMKVLGEIDSLEEKVRKGRIPRQRYKIQRKTLETRVDTLSRSLADYKEKMRAAGGHYASMMRELEVAEIELNEVEANIRSIEARHGRGELSLEGYRKLLGDYERRKEKTETTIDGILLRLREEIR